MSNTVEELIDENTFFSSLEKAGLSELLIESFREDKELFSKLKIPFEFKRCINGTSDTYYIKTNHPLYGSKSIHLEKYKTD